MQKTKPGFRFGFGGCVFCIFLLPALIITTTITVLSADGLCSSPPSQSDLPVDPTASWTPQEKKAWELIREGEPADMEGIERGGGKRTVSPEFISNILLYKKYGQAIRPQGVHFIGAIFDKKVDLSGFRLDRPLVFEKCHFGDKVDMSYIASSCGVRLIGSTFADDVDIGGARIDGSLDIASFGGGQTGDPLTPSKFMGVLILQNARINGQVFIGNSTFAKDLKMDGLRTDTFLEMTAIQCEGETTLGSAKPTQVIIEGGSYAGEVGMQSLNVDGNIYIYGKEEPLKFAKGVNLTGSRIAGALYFLNGTTTKVDLSGAEIHGELRLGVNFIEQSGSLDLILHNARIGSLSFPPTIGEVKSLDLIGCEYRRLNWIEESTGVLRIHDVAWLFNGYGERAMKWVEKSAVAGDLSSGPGMRYYSVQPYKQLAGVLKQEGSADLANAVLFASKDAERDSSGGRQWWLMTMQRYIIGYGYDYRFVLLSTSIFIIVGFFMIPAKAGGTKRSIVWRLVYSVDILLPVLQLEKTNYDDVHLSGWPMYYFYFHKAAGYLLASFIIAGISGLTK